MISTIPPPRNFHRRFVGGDPLERLVAAFRHVADHEQALRSSIEFDETAARSTFLCVSARTQSAGNRRPTPLPLKYVARRTGECSHDVALPRAAVPSPMLGLQSDSDDFWDPECSASTSPPTADEIGLHPAHKDNQDTSQLSTTQMRRQLASARRSRKSGLPSSSELSVQTAQAASNTSSQLEAHLLLKCLRVERSSLLFKYRSLWIEALDSHQQGLVVDIRPQWVIERRPIAAVILSRNMKMFNCREHFRTLRSALLRIQRVCWGHVGRRSVWQLASQRKLASVVQCLGRGYLGRSLLARCFASQLCEIRRDQSATIIQAKFRMCSARDKFLTLKVRCRCVVKIQRVTRAWLVRLRQRLLHDESARAERVLQCRMHMSDARSCEAAERVMIACEEADVRETLLGSICLLAAAFARLSLVDQLIANDVRFVPCTLASSVIATSSSDMTTPLLSSAVRLRAASSSERVPVMTTFLRRMRLQLVRHEQLESIDRLAHVLMLEQRERTFLRHQYLACLHRMVSL